MSGRGGLEPSAFVVMAVVALNVEFLSTKYTMCFGLRHGYPTHGSFDPCKCRTVDSVHNECNKLPTITVLFVHNY